MLLNPLAKRMQISKSEKKFLGPPLLNPGYAPVIRHCGYKIVRVYIIENHWLHCLLVYYNKKDIIYYQNEYNFSHTVFLAIFLMHQL